MSRVNKMPLRAILNETDLIIRNSDIVYFCGELDIIKDFVEQFSDSNKQREDIKDFLIKNEKYIDKEKLLFIIIKNYKENIELLKKHISKLTQNNVEHSTPDNFSELANHRLQLHQQQENLKKAIRLGRDIEQVYTYYHYDEQEKRYKIEIIDSKEIIEGKRISNTKALKRFEDVDNSFKERSARKDFGIEYALQSILLTDLINVFPNEKFGNEVRAMILENQVIKRGIKTKEELEALKTLDNYEAYSELVDGITFEGMFGDIKETLKEYVQYIDMDKLLLITAYRFEEALETGEINPEVHASIKEILEIILSNIKSNNAEIYCSLQDKMDGTFDLKDIKYSTKDLKTCISRFASDKYLTSSELEEYREKVNSCKINLSDIPLEHIDIVFSQSDLEMLSILSVDNLIYVFNKHEWDVSKIVELYETNIISLEYIKQIKDNIDLSGIVGFEKLNVYYNAMKDDSKNEEAASRYENYLNLYKEVFINGKDKEEIEKNSALIMEKIVEKLEEKEYDEAVKRYYGEGLLTLQSIAEWSNESLIIGLFNEKMINLEDMNQLVKDKKISADSVSDIYANLINNPDIEYNQRIALIREGFVKESDIFDLYKRNLLFEEDLRKMANDGLVRQKQMQKLVNSRTLEELERNSSIVLTGLNSLTKKNNEIYSFGSYSKDREEDRRSTGRYIIDPNEREKFIRTLNAYRANTDLSIDSPFFNYEFYVIPDESGTIGLNSVVIAERYYDDKISEAKFATDNATYFFKYKDLMVLSNLKKSEMTKERKGIVFTANHVIANEKREGRWATGVIACVAKTMLSSDLKEYNKANQRKIIQQKLSEIYTTQELISILSMASDIDLGEYICEIEEPIITASTKRKAISKAPKKSEDISDDTECR